MTAESESAREAIRRIGARVDRATDDIANRMDGLVTRLGERFDRLESRIDGRADTTSAEIGLARADLVELHKLVMLNVARIEVLERHIPAIRRRKSILERTGTKIIAAASGFSAIVIGLNHIPAFVRGWNAIWAFLGAKH